MNNFMDLCGLTGLHRPSDWGESFWHLGKLYQKRACTVCGLEQWRMVTVSVPADVDPRDVEPGCR